MQYTILKDKYKISKVTLGTAQLGMKYGINVERQPTKDEALEILKYAFENGVNSIDTAPIYGSSERIVGEFINKIDAHAQKTFVITKLEVQKYPDRLWQDKNVLLQRMKHELIESCMNIPLVKIPAYIFHFAEQAFRNDGMLLDELVEIKTKGYVELIGVSLYTDEELERCIYDTRIDIVQVPFSILDRRLLDSGLLQKAQKRGLIVFARSIFLQGLVFMDKLPPSIKKAKTILNNLHYLADNYFMSVNELCLRYVLSIDEISSIVIGIDSLTHLKENLSIVSKGPLDRVILQEIERLPQMPEELIDIRSWCQKFDFKTN